MMKKNTRDGTRTRTKEYFDKNKDTNNRHVNNKKYADRQKRVDKSIAENKKVDKKKTNRLYSYILVLAILVVVFILGSLGTYMFYYSQKTIAYSEFNLSVEVTERGTSFNTDTDKIDFAKNYLGGGGTKKINLYTKQDALVMIQMTGNITQFLSLSENNFLMHANTTREITIKLAIPKDSRLGEYEGKLKVYFYKQ